MDAEGRHKRSACHPQAPEEVVSRRQLPWAGDTSLASSCVVCEPGSRALLGPNLRSEPQAPCTCGFKSWLCLHGLW